MLSDLQENLVEAAIKNQKQLTRHFDSFNLPRYVEGQDVYQDVILAVLDGKVADENEDLVTYLHAVGSNIAKKIIRKERGRQVDSDGNKMPRLFLGETDAPSADYYVDNTYELLDLLGRINVDDANLFYQYHVEGYTLSELAVPLDITSQAVHARLRTIATTLRSL